MFWKVQSLYFFVWHFFWGACQSSRTNGQHGHHRWSVDTQNEHIRQSCFRSISPVLDTKIMFPVSPERWWTIWYVSFDRGKAFAALIDIVNRWIEIGGEKADPKVGWLKSRLRSSNTERLKLDWAGTRKIRQSFAIVALTSPWRLSKLMFPLELLFSYPSEV